MKYLFLEGPKKVVNISEKTKNKKQKLHRVSNYKPFLIKKKGNPPPKPKKPKASI